MKIQSNMYINNHNMTSRNIEKKENGSHALVQEDDIQISDSARKLVETARNKVSDFHTMHGKMGQAPMLSDHLPSARFRSPVRFPDRRRQSGQTGAAGPLK